MHSFGCVLRAHYYARAVVPMEYGAGLIIVARGRHSRIICIRLRIVRSEPDDMPLKSGDSDA